MVSAGGVRAGSAFVEIFAKDGQFQASMTRIQNRMKAVGTAMRQVGTQMAVGGAAIGLPMVMALRQFTAFDDAIRMTGAVSQSTAPQLAQLTNIARELGATTSFTATQVATLMGELGRAGFSPDQIEAMTGAVLDLSRATGTDATTSAGIMAATIRQFGMGATDAARVADVLTGAANKTFNSVESLGEAMQYAGPVAASMGMDIEQTAAILGTLGNVGIQGSEAGTALRRLLTITGAEAQKLQEIFGVSFLDAAGNVRPLVDTLGEVAAATNGMATGLRTAKFNEAFGLLGITAAGAIGAVAADTRMLEQELRRAGGTANITAKTMDAGLGGSLRILMSAIEGVSLAFGDALAPSLQIVAKGGQMLADVLRNLLKDFPIVAQIAAGAAGGLFALGTAAIVGGLAMQVMAKGLGVFAAVLRIIPALFSPVGIGLAILVGGVTLGVVAARQLSPAFRSETDAIMAALMRLDFSAAWNIMNLNFAIALVEMTAYADQTLRQLQGFFEATGSFIGDKLIEGLDRFMGLFGADIITLKESLDKLGVYFRAAFDWRFAMTGMSAALDEAERRAQQARAESPTADSRADARTVRRQEDADRRQAEAEASQAAFDATANELRDELRRAKEPPKPATEAPPGSPQADPASGQPGTPIGGSPAPTATTEASRGGRTVGGFFSSADGLGIGPDLAEPARATAENTAATAGHTAAIAAAMRGDGGSAVSGVPGVAAMAGAGGLPVPDLPGGGSAVAGSPAAALAPAAAAKAREGVDVAQSIRSVGDRISSGLEAVVTAIKDHAKLTESGNGLLGKLVENTGRPGPAFS